jgi:hypothetical protein
MTYADHPAVKWQDEGSPPDVLACVLDPQYPGDWDRSWIVTVDDRSLASNTINRVTLRRAVCDFGDEQASEWVSVDDAIGHVLGGGQ